MNPLFNMSLVWGWPRKGLFMTKNVTQEHFDATAETLVTKKQFEAAMNRIDTRFDEVVTFLKRLDQERVFTIEWIRRIESDVSLVKKHLKLA